MRTWWRLVIFMGCSILHTLSTCSDRPKIVCVPAGGRVSVPCSKPSTNEVAFTLFKDGEMIHSHTCNSELNTSNSHPSTNTVGAEYKGAENDSFNFALTGVNASSHGMYRCEGTVMYPPPLRSLPSTPAILLLIEGHQCNNCVNETLGGHQTSGSGWLWIVTLAVSSYSVAVTIGAVAIWVKWRKKDSQSEYVNTNPKAPRNKGRLYNPKPHFFYAPD